MGKTTYQLVQDFSHQQYHPGVSQLCFWVWDEGQPYVPGGSSQDLVVFFALVGIRPLRIGWSGTPDPNDLFMAYKWGVQTTLRLLGMSWGVKTTCLEAPGVSLGGSGVSIGGVGSLRVLTNWDDPPSRDPITERQRMIKECTSSPPKSNGI